MENDTEKTEDKNLHDLTPEKDAKGGRRSEDIARARKPTLSTSSSIGGPVPPIPAPDKDPDSTK